MSFLSTINNIFNAPTNSEYSIGSGYSENRQPIDDSISALPEQDRQSLEDIRDSWQSSICQWNPDQDIQEFGDPNYGEPKQETVLTPSSPDTLPDDVKSDVIDQGRNLQAQGITYTDDFETIEPYPAPTDSVEDMGDQLQNSGVEYQPVDDIDQ